MVAKEEGGSVKGREGTSRQAGVDNLAKLVKDALNGVFWRDDAQVVDLTVKKRYSDVPRTEVMIEEV